MQIISVVNRKGGCGKTTTAQALGSGLMNEGYKVLFIDLDSQENLSLILDASEEFLSSYDILQGKPIKHAIQGTETADIIKGDYMLSSLVKLDPYTLKKQLSELNGKYDYIIIDTPPNLDSVTVNALTASDRVIITSQSDLLGYKGINVLLETLEAVKQKFNQNLLIDGILLTRYNKRTVIQQQFREAIEELARDNDTKVYESYIRECNAIKEAQAMQTDIFSYSKNSNASKDYQAFINEFMGKEGQGNGK